MTTEHTSKGLSFFWVITVQHTGGDSCSSQMEASLDPGSPPRGTTPHAGREDRMRCCGCLPGEAQSGPEVANLLPTEVSAAPHGTSAGCGDSLVAQCLPTKKEVRSPTPGVGRSARLVF